MAVILRSSSVVPKLVSGKGIVLLLCAASFSLGQRGAIDLVELVDKVLDNPHPILGLEMKFFAAAGDRVAVAIQQHHNSHEVTPLQVDIIISILNDVFTHFELIKSEQDRIPRATMALLRDLES